MNLFPSEHQAEQNIRAERETKRDNCRFSQGPSVPTLQLLAG